MTNVRVPAKTLKQPALLTGIGLHSGEQATVRLCPATPGESIRFIRTDLPGRPHISVQSVDPNGPPFRTTLGNGAVQVHTVEHLLSALSGLGITDCAIEIDNTEVPGMDGSALPFAEAIQTAGISEHGLIDVLVVDETIEFRDGTASLSARPYSGGLKISYTLDYPGHPLAQGRYEFALGEESYLKDIAAARTFAIKKDAEAMLAAGLGKGANLQNTIVIDGSRAIETKLRFDNEPVRHKILDLIGDLYVIGRPVHAAIEAVCSGHRGNRALAQKIAGYG